MHFFWGSFDLAATRSLEVPREEDTSPAGVAVLEAPDAVGRSFRAVAVLGLHEGGFGGSFRIVELRQARVHLGEPGQQEVLRIGRAGHSVGEPSKGTLYPKHRGDLLEAASQSLQMPQCQPRSRGHQLVNRVVIVGQASSQKKRTSTLPVTS